MTRCWLGVLKGLVVSFSVAGAVAPLAAPVKSEALTAARKYREQHGAAILRDYAELLRIPNTPAHPEGLRRTAATIAERLRAQGVKAELLELDGARREVPPIVYGRLDVPGAQRTLGIYVHYDGQPVDPTAWSHPPFEPTLYTAALDRGGEVRAFPKDDEPIDPEWRIYARAAGDDKAPVPAMVGALRALRQHGVSVTSNLVFFFEGEEERGSDHLGDYLDQYRQRLADVDLWLICDGPMHQSRRPQLVFGVRGYSGLDLRVFGARRYLHSGHYGNWAPNPAQVLAGLLASFKDHEGQVLIDGFYDSVTALSPRERQAVADVPNTDAALRRELGLARTEGGNASLLDRILLPSFNIRGLASATVGETARNVIPTVAEASIDIRLVKGNVPEAMLDLVERHIRGQGFHIVRAEPDEATRLRHPRIVQVVRRGGYPAVRTPVDLPELAPVVAAADAAAGGELVLMPSLGGSLPLYLFEGKLGHPLVIVPIANHDNNQHAPDENIRVGNLWFGIDLFAALFTMPGN